MGQRESDCCEASSSILAGRIIPGKKNFFRHIRKLLRLWATCLLYTSSMGLFFIADILGGNKVVLVGSLIQAQMTRGNNWPFAAALAVIMMILTTLMILLYRKVTNAKEVEGMG